MTETRRALVTGSVGFIGSRMVRELRQRGWAVWGMDLADPKGLLSMEGWMAKDSMIYDLVIHAAYWVGGRVGIDGLNTNLAKNAVLDGTLFDWAVRTRQRRVLYFSSSAAYPVGLQTGPSQGSLKEDDIDHDAPHLPDAAYGWAKLSGERMAAMARACGIPVTVVRPFSGYSGQQSEDYPFPSILGRAVRGNHYVWGPRGQTRDWIHVIDVINGALAVSDSGTEDPVNLCTGLPTTMEELMREAVRQLRLMHPDIYPRADEVTIKHLLDQPTGVLYRVGHPSRMLTHYTPKIALEEGIQAALVRLGALRAFPK